MKTEHLWMVRAGFKNALAAWVEQKGAIAIGWHMTGDLSRLKNYEEFYATYVRSYPNDKGIRARVMVGQLFKFASEILVGDYIVTYVTTSSKYLLGRVKSDYIYDPALFSAEYPHVRNVEWKSHFGRRELSSSASKSLGSILTVFNIDKHIGEVLNINNSR